MLTFGTLAACCVMAISLAACSGQVPASASEKDKEQVPVFHAVAIRYQVKDVDGSVEFYTKHLAFKLEQKAGTAFAKISNGNLVLWLSGPKSSGSRPMPDGRKQQPGGWNRIALEVRDLP